MNPQVSFLAPKKWILWLMLILVFGLGLLIRLYDLFDAPLDFHPARQMHSALIARGMYYQDRSDIPEWQQTLAMRQWQAEPHPEPRFLERLVALAYRISGGEKLWVARLFSILFWLAGGIALFLLSSQLFGSDGALVAVLYFLILPYGTIASRSFQPDPLMVALLAFTLWGIVRWQKESSLKNAILAGLLGGAAIYIKAVAVFFVAGAWLGILIGGKGLRGALRSPQLWAAGILSLGPALAYYIYGLYGAGFLQNEISLRFFPPMWLDPIFYLRWNSELSSVVGFEWFLVALLGTMLIRERAWRGLFLGLWLGYFIYGMTLPYHISTHDYYQLPLILLVAMGLGAGAQAIFRQLNGSRLVQIAIVAFVLCFAVTVKAWDVRVSLKRMNYAGEVAFWQSLGERIGHDAAVVSLAQDSGSRLAYWGWVDNSAWLSSSDINLRTLAGRSLDVQALFEDAIAGKDYFIVTMFNELERQPEVAEMLSHYAIDAQADDFVIYDLRSPPNP